MLWLKSIHIIFMVTWFAGLFYLPRLFVYHAMANDTISIERFKVMESKLFYAITTPGALITLASGIWLWLGFHITGNWLIIKLILVLLLIIYHLMCWHLLTVFQSDQNRRSPLWYRWFNEVPVLLLLGIVLLVEFKPAFSLG